MVQKTNILLIKNENTGNQLKAGDRTVLKYQLADGNQEPLELEGLSAKISLLKESKIVYQTEAVVLAENRVHFSIDETLNPGTYTLEIIVDDKYIFPSNTDEKLYLVYSSKNFQEEVVQTYGIEQLKQEVEEKCQTYLEEQLLLPSTNQEIEQLQSQVNEISEKVSQIQSMNSYDYGNGPMILKSIINVRKSEKIESDKKFTIAVKESEHAEFSFVQLDFFQDVNDRSKGGFTQVSFAKSLFGRPRSPHTPKIYLWDEEKTIHELRVSLCYEKSYSDGEFEDLYHVEFLDTVPFYLTRMDAILLSRSTN